MRAPSKAVKAISIPLFSAIFAFAVVAPAFAVETGGTGETEAQKAATAACTRITSLANAGKGMVAGKRSELQTDFAERLTKISTTQTGIDQKVSDARTAATVKFEEKIKSLQAREGLTADQLTAIDTYKTSVQQAEATRATAIDDARSAYRTALATSVATQQQTLSTATTTYQAAITAAFATAEANCSEGTAAATLTTLKASIKSAREALAAARTPERVKTSIKALATTREAAVKAANQTFAATVKGLTTTLKTALQVKN